MLDKINSQSSISNDDVLQPISKFYPPNNIISKDYPPDQKPMLKLIKPQQPLYNVTCQELKKKYNSIFNEDDNLGFHYSHLLFNNIVFLKFNNQSYMKYKSKNKNIKFLSGLFLSAETIQNQQIKNSKNVYKTLPDLEYVEFKSNNFESFGKNCKGRGKDLKFSSNFESGNLFITMKKKQFQYDFFLQNDINSKGNTQWFNFCVEFKLQGVYKFNILNFTKSHSLFENGMKILYYSEKESEKYLSKNAWVRGCSNIKYYPSSVTREESDTKKYYCLSFEYENPYNFDKVNFAYSYPYTSLDLQKFFKKILYRKINVHMKMEKFKICQSLSGLPIVSYVIQHKKMHKVQSQSNTLYTKKNTNIKENMCIVFLARQHSGQTQGSFVIEGIMQFLMENGQNDYLKKNFTFIVIPMLNVDGVLYGNYRTNLSGQDLNRIWRYPNKDLHPQVFYVKRYLQNVHKSFPISVIIDIHGHSKSLNSFFYGNPHKKDIVYGPQEDPRLFPYFCSKRIKQISFLQSTFHISEDKKNSARVVLSQIFPKSLVYTLQNSFYGWMKDNSVQEYTIDVLKRIGKDLILTYLQYDRLSDKNPEIKQKWAKQINELKNRKQNQKVEQMKQDAGDSDSEAQFQLINLLKQQKQQYKKDEKQVSLFQPEIQRKSIFRKTIAEYSVKKSINIQRNLIEKRKKNHSPPMISQSSVGEICKDRNNIPFTSSHSQGFLSIVKIKPNGENYSELNLKKRDPLKFMKNQLISPRKQQNKQWAIDKLKKKKIKIEQAMNSCSGMKSFLRAMNIPLQKKY